MIIYKKYDQQQLDLQYNNRFHVPDFEISLQRWVSLSRLSEKKYRVIKDISYGNNPCECLDIFPSDNPLSKTLIFIHGGYWQKFNKSDFHFIAGAFADYGITTAIINYPLVPLVTIDQVVESCSKAVDWVHKHIAEWNGDPDQMFITGHSAGAHLAAMIISSEEMKTNKTNIKGVCAISGLYNLVPIQLSNINDVLKMDMVAATNNSPARKTTLETCPLLIAVGEKETDEFLDQSRELYNNWKNKNQIIELLEIPELNHFTILDSFYDRNSLLHQSMCELMSL